MRVGEVLQLESVPERSVDRYHQGCPEAITARRIAAAITAFSIRRNVVVVSELITGHLPFLSRGSRDPSAQRLSLHDRVEPLFLERSQAAIQRMFA